MYVSAWSSDSLANCCVGLLDSGEVWSTKEATDLFFGITKLFQHNDVYFLSKAFMLIIGCSTANGVCHYQRSVEYCRRYYHDHFKYK